MANTVERREASVAISRRHSGQIVTPVVTAYYLGRGRHRKVCVSLYWHDASEQPGRQDGPTQEFVAASVKAAEGWLEAEGVSLDAQGIH